MTHETILSTFEAANEFVRMQGFESLPDTIYNPDSRFLCWNRRGQMLMARVLLNYQERGNTVFEIQIVD